MIDANRTVVLIPTYNEVENIGLTIENIFSVDSDFSVLVLDDNSPDGTGKIVNEKMEKFPNLSLLTRTNNKGFTQSYIDGFERVLRDGEYNVVVTMDADFSHDPKELPFLLKRLRRGDDLVVGSRYVRKQPFPGISWWRRALSSFANYYVKTILRLPISDCTSGFIAMKTTTLTRLRLEKIRIEGYGFLFELKYQVYLLGLQLGEHPVKWPTRHLGASKMNFKRIFESALLPWKIRLAGEFRLRDVRPVKS